tara:strand:- start:1385 stop:1780 length:396 start_codon:yes stop_codon:yes gene_type:complete
MKRITALCNPAMFYLVISGISFLFILLQNLNNQNELCVGDMKCNTEYKIFVFVAKIGYILFWTWMLDLMCKGGYTNVAWFILFFPFILFFILLALFILASVGSTIEQSAEKTFSNNVEPLGGLYNDDFDVL